MATNGPFAMDMDVTYFIETKLPRQTLIRKKNQTDEARRGWLTKDNH
jgi:hypothetical protein